MHGVKYQRWVGAIVENVQKVALYSRPRFSFYFTDDSRIRTLKNLRLENRQPTRIVRSECPETSHTTASLISAMSRLYVGALQCFTVRTKNFCGNFVRVCGWTLGRKASDDPGTLARISAFLVFDGCLQVALCFASTLRDTRVGR